MTAMPTTGFWTIWIFVDVIKQLYIPVQRLAANNKCHIVCVYQFKLRILKLSLGFLFPPFIFHSICISVPEHLPIFSAQIGFASESNSSSGYSSEAHSYWLLKIQRQFFGVNHRALKMHKNGFSVNRVWTMNVLYYTFTYTRYTIVSAYNVDYANWNDYRSTILNFSPFL